MTVSLAHLRKSRVPGRGLFRPLAQLWRNADGNTMLEFAFVGPPFIVLITGVLYIALAYLAQDGLESATESASRLMLTGVAQTATYGGHTGLSSSDFQTLICNGGTITTSTGSSMTVQKMLPPYLTCNSLSVNVMPIASYSASNTGLPTYNCYGSVCNSAGSPNATGSATGSAIAGLQGKPTLVQLIYNWTTVAGLFGMGDNSGPTHFSATSGHMKMVATSVFTTEQYTCASGQASC